MKGNNENTFTEAGTVTFVIPREHEMDEDNYRNFRVLLNHDAMMLQEGDFIEGPRGLVMVKKIFRNGNVVLDNGYQFDRRPNAVRGKGQGHRHPMWSSVRIYRPLNKFRPFGVLQGNVVPQS